LIRSYNLERAGFDLIRAKPNDEAQVVDDKVQIVNDELSAYRLLHLDSARLRDPSERLGSDALAADASNLPTVLANLPDPTLGEIRADLVSLVPGISSFELVPDGDAFRIDFELSGGERLPARLVCARNRSTSASSTSSGAMVSSSRAQGRSVRRRARIAVA
jgi:hypothetical protein